MQVKEGCEDHSQTSLNPRKILGKKTYQVLQSRDLNGKRNPCICEKITAEADTPSFCRSLPASQQEQRGSEPGSAGPEEDPQPGAGESWAVRPSGGSSHGAGGLGERQPPDCTTTAPSTHRSHPAPPDRAREPGGNRAPTHSPHSPSNGRPLRQGGLRHPSPPQTRTGPRHNPAKHGPWKVAEIEEVAPGHRNVAAARMTADGTHHHPGDSPRCRLPTSPTPQCTAPAEKLPRGGRGSARC